MKIVFWGEAGKEKKKMRVSKKNMVEFLKEHYRYHTMNSWNNSTSYAAKVKIYSIGLSTKQKNIAYQLLDCNETYDNINMIMEEWGRKHDYRYQAGFNGRSGGYIVLIQGGKKSTGHKSRCKSCYQLNYQSINENGNICGKCNKPTRIDLIAPYYEAYTTPGRSMDMNEDFTEWSYEQVKGRYSLIKDFDNMVNDCI